jgi:type IV secretory pathway VirB10-like protein
MHSPNRIIKPLGLVTFALPALFAAVAVGCGGDSTPPPAKPEVTSAPPTPPPPATSAAPETPPADPATKPDAGPPPPPQASQERPPVLLSHEKELVAPVSSSPGAKFEIGDDTGRAIFRIREGALSSPHVFTFKSDTKAKTTGIPVGKTYRLIVQLENSSATPKVETADKPFEFTFPTAGKKEVNLAIGEITLDAKGVEKITWTVIAPEKVDESMGAATFKLPAVGNYHMHMTLKAPTAPPAAK